MVVWLARRARGFTRPAIPRLNSRSDRSASHRHNHERPDCIEHELERSAVRLQHRTDDTVTQQNASFLDHSSTCSDALRPAVPELPLTLRSDRCLASNIAWCRKNLARAY